MTQVHRRATLPAGCLFLFLLGWAAGPLWAQGTATAAPQGWLAEFVARYGFGIGLLAVFVSGLALNFTPCVYPMIPVTMAFFSSQSAGAPGRVARLALYYILGMSLTYAVLGFMAAKTGALLGSWLQQPAVLVAVMLVMVALALSMFGLYELRLPRALMNRLGQASGGPWGAVVMGMVVGLVAAPCIGPFVLGLMVLTSRLANPLLGFLLFFVLGLGMGAPYIVLGIAANRVGHWPRAGDWLLWSKQLLGFVLIGAAIYFVHMLLPRWLLAVLITLLLVGAGVYLGWLARSTSRSVRFRFVRWVVGAVLILAGLVFAWPKPAPGPSIAWVPYTEAALAQARQEGYPVLIDIYADWCLPCVELDHVTFRHPDVVTALAHFTTLRLDTTREVSEAEEALLERHQVYGVPTLLLFDRSGQERRELRLLGFERPREFIERLGKVP